MANGSATNHALIVSYAPSFTHGIGRTVLEKAGLYLNLVLHHYNRYSTI